LSLNEFPQGVGGFLPWNLLVSAIALVGNLPGNTERKVDTSLLREQFSQPVDHEERGNIHFENTALYSPLVYIPAAIGIWIADHIFSAAPVVLLYAGRVCTLAAWIGLVYMAVRLLPVGKWLLAVLGLAPMALFQGASVSADALSAGLAFLSVAWFVRLVLQQQTVTHKQWIATGLLVLALGFIKQPYALFGVLFLTLPSTAFASLKHRLQFVLSVVVRLQ
jgi:uncharacterized membrane protein